LWSTYLCFAEAIVENVFREEPLLKSFNTLVDEKDYAGNEKKEIIDFLEELSETGRGMPILA